MVAFKFQNNFMFIIQLIICTSVYMLFLAVIIDFMFFSRKKGVKKEKKSIVETGTMTLFFIIFYMILKKNIGTIDISNNLIEKSLIIIGTIFIVIGCILNIKGRFNLGSNWANHIKVYESHSLVQEGMYEIVRHPLYASIMLMFYGGCLAYRNIISFILVSFIFVPFMYYRAKQEENLLIQHFPEYDLYKKKTGMFIPKIMKRKDI